MILSRLDEMGRAPLIALVVLGFWFWWPLGLAALAYIAFGRNREGRLAGPGRWYNAPSDATSTTGDQVRNPWGPGAMGSGWGGGWGCKSRRQHAQAAPSGNRAFDEYRTETLKRLEDEQREFVEYLERLRQARDKSEFDSFMADRRNRQTPTPPTSEAA